MRLSRRAWILVLPITAVVIVLIAANIQQLGQAAGGFYDWTCAECGAGLYCCPGKRLRSLRVPATYQAHAHNWQLAHRPPHWSPWKPWQWLVYLTVNDRHELQGQQPEAVFPTAHVDWRYAVSEGLRTLATDPRYQRKNELPEE